ncbi:MAG: hypothetical protein IJC83_04425 [Oscillospiraceae bacterium]|nr:hypothetical protein [Oscillospiraceae bacterium]
MEQNLKFFLGANTPLGFVSRFDMLNNYELYIIKGGPGTGKSSLMKKVASGFNNAETIYCSSDPNSLDAVILPEQKIAIADGTSPHTLEPRYLGISEHIVNLCGCLDSKKLKQNADELIPLFNKNSLCHTRSCRFLAAASSLISDTYHLSLDVALCEKAKKFANKLAMREIANNLPQKAHEDIRFLSAVTSKGITVYEDTAQTLAEKLFVIDDNFGAVSRIILDEIRKFALSKAITLSRAIAHFRLMKS